MKNYFCQGFNEIWTDFLPWKTVKNLVEYYYMWKTTDRYVQQKRVKAVESEQKLKQVYVPDYSKIGAGSRLVRGLRDDYEFAADTLYGVKLFALIRKYLQVTGRCPLLRVWARCASAAAPPRPPHGTRSRGQS